IAKMYGISNDGTGQMQIVMEWIPHGSLNKLLTKRESLYNPFAPKAVTSLSWKENIRRNVDGLDGAVEWNVRVRIEVDVAKAMEYLHSCDPPVLHRDLKSSNIMISSNIDDNVGDAEVLAKVVDFGTARLLIHKVNDDSQVDNPVWMAPEIFQYSIKSKVHHF